jgi:hypothetical protein
VWREMHGIGSPDLSLPVGELGAVASGELGQLQILIPAWRWGSLIHGAAWGGVLVVRGSRGSLDFPRPPRREPHRRWAAGS